MKETKLAPTRLEDAIKQLLPDAHGHQQNSLQARFMVGRLPQAGDIRLAIDWTQEQGKHLLVASLRYFSLKVSL